MHVKYVWHNWKKQKHIVQVPKSLTLESFRFEDEDENEDEDEALCFRHNEIFKLFRLQLGRDNVVAINFVVPAKLKTKKFEDFVVVKTESFVLVLDFVLVLESKALYSLKRTGIHS